MVVVAFKLILSGGQAVDPHQDVTGRLSAPSSVVYGGVSTAGTINEQIVGGQAVVYDAGVDVEQTVSRRSTKTGFERNYHAAYGHTGVFAFWAVGIDRAVKVEGIARIVCAAGIVGLEHNRSATSIAAGGTKAACVNTAPCDIGTANGYVAGIVASRGFILAPEAMPKVTCLSSVLITRVPVRTIPSGIAWTCGSAAAPLPVRVNSVHLATGPNLGRTPVTPAQA